MKIKKPKKAKKPKPLVPIGRIKVMMRNLHRQCPQKKLAKKRARIDPELYKCEFCGKLSYEGKSEKNFGKYQLKYTDIEITRDRLHADHKNPVVDTKEGFISLDEYAKSTWVPADMLNIICKECHQKKTDRETQERVESGSLKRKS